MEKRLSRRFHFESVSRSYHELIKCLSGDLPAYLVSEKYNKLSREKKTEGLCRQIISIVGDRDPDKSLAESEACPFPQFSTRLGGKDISPLQYWTQLEMGSRFWPAPVRHASRDLGIGSGKLPKWPQIEKFYHGVGFKALPVLGRIEEPVYSFLLSHRIAPVSTHYVVRHEKSPYNWYPIDAFHDFGHGLAMAMPDYNRAIVQFSKAVFSLYSSGKRKCQKKIGHSFLTLFELGYVHGKRGFVEPVGSIALTLENLRYTAEGLLPRVSGSRQGFFPHREQWRQAVDKAIFHLPEV